MRRSTPACLSMLETLAEAPIDVQKYTCKGLAYEIKYAGSKRGQLFFQCHYAARAISDNVTLEEAIETCQLHAVKNYISGGRRSAVKPSTKNSTQGQITKQVYNNISKSNPEALDNFLEFTAPCELTDLGMDFGGNLW